MDAVAKPIGRMDVLPYRPALDALAAHLGDCLPCQADGTDCPEGAALTANLRAARTRQTETARWN